MWTCHRLVHKTNTLTLTKEARFERYKIVTPQRNKNVQWGNDLTNGTIVQSICVFIYKKSQQKGAKGFLCKP